MPSLAIYITSGKDCLKFPKKEDSSKNNPPNNYTLNPESHSPAFNIFILLTVSFCKRL